MTERSLSETLLDNLKQIRENIAEAAQKAGRSDKIRLMGVTKTVAPELINLSVANGVDLLGENRVQEFLDKRESYRGEFEVHFIGSLQTNKVKYIADKVSMIHSADSGKLITEIGKRAAAAGRVMDILLEVNIGGEESKGGIVPEAVSELAGFAGETGGVRLRGLMAIPPIDENGSSEKYFEKMQRLFSDLKASTAGDGRYLVDTLSMGMSGDYVSAIKYGSTIVRIGSLLYGKRIYK